MNANNNCYVKCDEVTEILKKIEEIQKRAVKEELSEQYCDYGFLEDDIRKYEKNTRPIQIYTNDDEPWFCPINRNEISCERLENCHNSTCVFRVEKVENGSVYLRALKAVDNYEDHNCKERFKSTDSFITIKIDKIAAIRCLKDTFVDICIR